MRFTTEAAPGRAGVTFWQPCLFSSWLRTDPAVLLTQVSYAEQRTLLLPYRLHSILSCSRDKA